MRVGLALGMMLAASGCGQNAPDETAATGGPVAGCKLAPVGDVSKPIEMKLVAAGVNDQGLMQFAGTPKPIADGSVIPMIVPPQGGWVIYVGARANNIDPCGVQVKGVLTDPATQQVTVDERTAKLTVGTDGWAGPLEHDPLAGALANVAVCPNQWASNDMYGNTFKLTVTLTERSGRSASQSIDVKLECAEAQYKNSCSCQCKKNYVLGESCQ
jgi:hypothetical protein